jgi:hypothetical protein
VRWLGFFVSVICVLYLSSPFLGIKTRDKKLAYQEELKNLDLNSLCAGTQRCSAEELAFQEQEEKKIIEGFQEYF